MHAGTKGVTDGEPGTEAHCCGMKGLGGATVELLCIPKQVARGEPFTVNVHYTTDVKRPVDVHVGKRVFFFLNFAFLIKSLEGLGGGMLEFTFSYLVALICKRNVLNRPLPLLLCYTNRWTSLTLKQR